MAQYPGISLVARLHCHLDTIHIICHWMESSVIKKCWPPHPQEGRWAAAEAWRGLLGAGEPAAWTVRTHGDAGNGGVWLAGADNTDISLVLRAAGGSICCWWIRREWSGGKLIGKSSGSILGSRQFLPTFKTFLLSIQKNWLDVLTKTSTVWQSWKLIIS